MSTPLVHLEGVSRTYPASPPVHALRGVSTRFDAGQVTAVVGRSGSGKSTLLHVLGLLDRPDRGSYLLAGQDVAKLTEKRRTTLRASHIGFIFQQFHLVPYRTAVENVEIALQPLKLGKRQRMDIARRKLASVGLADRTHHYPAQLSGGEQQRVSIARALATDPALLLCDEPTGNLDSQTAASVMDLLLKLPEHTEAPATVIVVTHDMDIAGHADRILTMADGSLTEVPRST